MTSMRFWRRWGSEESRRLFKEVIADVLKMKPPVRPLPRRPAKKTKAMTMHTNSERKPQCAWCHKSQDDVEVLIATPTGVVPRSLICDECIAVCNSILEDRGYPGTSKA